MLLCCCYRWGCWHAHVLQSPPEGTACAPTTAKLPSRDTRGEMWSTVSPCLIWCLWMRIRVSAWAPGWSFGGGTRGGGGERSTVTGEANPGIGDGIIPRAGAASKPAVSMQRGATRAQAAGDAWHGRCEPRPPVMQGRGSASPGRRWVGRRPAGGRTAPSRRWVGGERCGAGGGISGSRVGR